MAKPSQVMILAEEIARRIIAEQTMIRFQIAEDAAVIAAHDVLKLGPGRSEAFCEAFRKALDDIAGSFKADNKDDKDMVYTKETLDRRVEPIYGSKMFRPFTVRYGGDVRMDCKQRIRRK